MLFAVVAIFFGLLSGYAMAYSLMNGIGMSYTTSDIPWRVHGGLVGLVVVMVLVIGIVISWRFGKRSILQNLATE